MTRGTMTGGPWLRPPDASPEARVRLFLFHYAGGGIAMYSRWPALLPSDIACQRVQLPGRHERHRERPFTSLEPLLAALVEVFDAEHDGRPFVLFGHSMGALLAYRLGVALSKAGLPGPDLVAVAGWSPAALATPPPALSRPHSLAPPPFSASGSGRVLGAEAAAAGRGNVGGGEIAAAGGGNVGAGEDPAGGGEDGGNALRADVAVCAGYRDDGAALECPVVAYAGSEDPLLPSEAMRSWDRRGTAYLGCREFPGGHFFIHDHAEAIAADLVQVIHQRVG